MGRVPPGARSRWDPRGQHRGRSSVGRRGVPGLAESGRDARIGDPSRLRSAAVPPVEETDQPAERVPGLRIPATERVRHPRLRVHPPVPERELASVPAPRPGPSRESVLAGRTGPLVQSGLDRPPRRPSGFPLGPKRSVPDGARRADCAHVLGGGRHRPRPVRRHGDHALGRRALGSARHRCRVGSRGLPRSRLERAVPGVHEFVSGAGNSSAGFEGEAPARWAISSSTAILRYRSAEALSRSMWRRR